MDFSQYETMSFSRRGRVLTIQLDRADALNAVNARLHAELARVFRDADEDSESDIIVLTGKGRAFSAGGDMKWLTTSVGDANNFRRTIPEAKRIVFDLLDMEKPILCALNGPAIGLGATVALLCDIIIASDKATIGDPHVKMGLVAGDGGAVIWPQLIGYARAKEFLFTGRIIDAKEAHRIGLINRVVAPEALASEVDSLADELAGGAVWAIRYTKNVTNIPLRALARQIMDASMAYEMETTHTDDHREAVAAFLEKRKPRFTGR